MRLLKVPPTPRGGWGCVRVAGHANCQFLRRLQAGSPAVPQRAAVQTQAEMGYGVAGDGGRGREEAAWGAGRSTHMAAPGLAGAQLGQRGGLEGSRGQVGGQQRAGWGAAVNAH